MNITIVGAGLAGSLLAIYLAKRGFNVKVYECRPDMRTTTISAGRSINLTLSARGISALKRIGLEYVILKKAIPMHGRMTHRIGQENRLQPYSQSDSDFIYSISRTNLNIELMNLAEAFPNVKIHFNQRATAANFETNSLTFFNENNNQSTTIQADTIIATDGANSVIRTEMEKQGLINATVEPLERSYKELQIPPNENGSFQMEKNALHIWPRHSFMMIALPNPDASFTNTLFFADKGPLSFETLNNDTVINNFFQEYFPDAVPMMPTLLHDFNQNPIGKLATIRSFPWHYKNKTLLLGDSAHGVVPFYGQGMNCAFENAVALDNCIEKYSPDWQKIYVQYQLERKIQSDAIADLALQNFVEMRDLTADPTFIKKRKLELMLENQYPNQFLSKYSMVTFHQIPYHTALHKGNKQDELLMNICKQTPDVEQLDLEKVFQQLQGL